MLAQLPGFRRLPRKHFAILYIPWLVGLASIVHAPAETGAQTLETKLVAQKKAREGRRLAEQGQHEKALELFRQAYEIQSDPGYLYNVAIEFQTLGREVEAAESFDKFLRDAQNIAPEFIADAHQQRRELRKRLGEIDVHCTQEGARVLVDNQDKGSTPVDHALLVTAGSHRVTIVKTGFDPFHATVELAKGSHTNIQATLRMSGAVPAPSGSQTASGSPATSSISPPASSVPLLASSVPPPSLPAAAASGSSSPPPSTPAAWLPPVEPPTERMPDAPRAHIAAFAGATFWSGVPNDPEPSATFALGAGYTILRLSHRADVRLGVKGGLTFLSEHSDRDLFISALFDPMLKLAIVPNRLYAFCEVGVGVLILSGIPNNSVLLAPTAGTVTGSLAAFELHPAIGVGYSFNPWFSLFVSPGLAFSPRPSPYFQNPQLWRIEIGGGLMIHL